MLKRLFRDGPNGEEFKMFCRICQVVVDGRLLQRQCETGDDLDSLCIEFLLDIIDLHGASVVTQAPTEREHCTIGVLGVILPAWM